MGVFWMRSSAAALIATFTATLALCAPAAAQAPNKAEQKCINAINKRTASLAKTQGKEVTACVKAAGAGSVDALGTPPQEQTAQACLDNDIKGKVGKSITALSDNDTALCSADTPAFGYTGSTTSTSAATSQVNALAGDLFGTDLDSVTINATYADAVAPKCQSEAIKRSTSLADALWKIALKAKKSALKGKLGAAPTSSIELQLAVMGYVEADASGKGAKAVAKLTDKIESTCANTAAAPADLFPGDCRGSADYSELAGCAATVARCRFCRALAATDAFETDCDAFDDGDAGNDSCDAFAAGRQITDAADLMTGPLAHGEVGDYLLANDKVRFIIQDAPKRDMYSVGCFGGNIIDAERVDTPGKENFLEIQPALNIETVINAESVEIVNDGADGTAAIVRTCGPDDILDFVNGSTVVEDFGLPFPVAANDTDYDIYACTEYILEPGKDYLRMVTTVTNNEASDLGQYVGDYINAAGEFEMWGSTSGAGLGEQLTHAGDAGVISYIGYGEAAGVDVSYVTLVDPDATFGSSFFATAGVTYALFGQRVVNALAGQAALFVVPAGGSNSFTRYFGVGDGSGSNAIDIENEVKGLETGTLEGCVTIGGAPAPGARVTAGPENSGALVGVRSNWTTDASGCYSGTLVTGLYGVAGWSEGAPFEGDGATPTVHSVEITEGATTIQDIALPATGTLEVTVIDENSLAIPARVSVVGFDPSPEQTRPSVFDTTGLFRDQNEIVPFGLVAAAYTDAAGQVSLPVEPGSYQLFVSRGTEYSAFEQPLTITAGATTNVAAQIALVIDTPGFVSSDFHVHGINSADSRVNHTERIQQFAGEGVDNLVMTDHHAHTDLDPEITALGFASFLGSTIGEEVTTWDSGHYIAYPMTVDPSRPSGGSSDWGRAAPVGEDFVEYGSYIATPAETDAIILGNPNATADTVVQIAHIDSHFVPLQIDTGLVPPVSSLDAAGKLRYRLDPSSGNLFHHFPALELWNGSDRGNQSQFLDERMGIWHNLLNQGLPSTFIADTDTHRYTRLTGSGARSWTASSTDDPASISDAEVAQSVDAGKATGGQGVYVQTRLVAVENAALVADLTLSGDTLVAITDPVQGVELEIDVQAPAWAPYDRIEVYANATTIPAPTQPDVPELYSSTPAVTLNAGVDFTVVSTDVFPGIPGATRLSTTVTVPFPNLAGDTWFTVVVKGTDGVSNPMFPIYPRNLDSGSNTTLADLLDGNLGEQGVMALGGTNALYVDADGTPGFQGPSEP